MSWQRVREILKFQSVTVLSINEAVTASTHQPAVLCKPLRTHPDVASPFPPSQGLASLSVFMNLKSNHHTSTRQNQHSIFPILFLSNSVQMQRKASGWLKGITGQSKAIPPTPPPDCLQRFKVPLAPLAELSFSFRQMPLPLRLSMSIRQ